MLYVKTRSAPDGLAEARKTRLQTLQAKLTEEILSGVLSPGTRLDEQEIADRFGVSRTPVREAIRHLIGVGLAESKPRQGTTVLQLSAERLVALCDASVELDVVCARLAALRMNGEQRLELASHHQRMSKYLADGEAYFELSDRFHDMICLGTHNSILIDTVRALRARMSAVGSATGSNAEVLARSYAEHQRILDAILAGDAQTSEAAMRDHRASAPSCRSARSK